MNFKGLTDAAITARHFQAVDFDEVSHRFDGTPDAELLAALDACARKYPGLHPDDASDWDGEDFWDEGVEEYRDLLDTAWLRVTLGRISEEDIYRVDAQRAAFEGRE